MAAMDVQVRIRAIDQFSSTLDKLQRKLKSLDGAKGGLGANDGLGAAYGRRADRLAKSVAHAEQKHAAATQPAGAMSGMPAFGVPASVLGAGAAAFGGAAVVRSAADFESAMTEIQKKSGASAEEMERLGNEVRDLAASGEVAVPLSELLGAYERGAAAGIPLAELREFAILSAKASDAFGMTAEQVGNFSAKLETGLKLSKAEIKDVFDLTNSLADAGIADESAIVDFVDRSGATLKTLGLTMGQTLALGSTLLNIGMTSDIASSGMDALATRMQTVGTLSGKGKKTFERFMGPVGEFAGLVEKDANGALLLMLDRLNELSGADRMEFLSQFIGQEHAGKILRLAEAIGELRRNQALANDRSAWSGSLDTSYQLKLDDFWSQFEVLKNAFENLRITAGTIGLGVMTDGLQTVTGIVKEIDEGLKAFEARVDWSSVDDAKAAVTELAKQIGEVLGLDTTNSSILQFFRDLAEAVNNVAAGISATKEFIQYLNDPMGLNTKEGRRAPEPETGDGWFEKYRRESVRPDSPLDKALGFLGGWMDEADRRHKAAAPKRPADDLNIKPEDTMPAMRTGRLRPAPYDPFAEGRVPDAAATPAPEMDPAMLERMRQRAQIAPPAANSVVPANPIPAPPPNLTPTPAATLPDISSVPIPVSRPEIDTSAFLQGTSAIEAAKAGIATPVMATADMNIAPLLSKVEQAKAAVRSLDAMSATVGAGNGGNFEARANDQF